MREKRNVHGKAIKVRCSLDLLGLAQDLFMAPHHLLFLWWSSTQHMWVSCRRLSSREDMIGKMLYEQQRLPRSTAVLPQQSSERQLLKLLEWAIQGCQSHASETPTASLQTRKHLAMRTKTLL